MMITHPIDLIVANALHKAAQTEQAMINLASSLGIQSRRLIPEKMVREQTARDILSGIANHADLEIVLKCLAICGAPASLHLVGEGLQAVKDRQRA